MKQFGGRGTNAKAIYIERANLLNWTKKYSLYSILGDLFTFDDRACLSDSMFKLVFAILFFRIPELRPLVQKNLHSKELLEQRTQNLSTNNRIEIIRELINTHTIYFFPPQQNKTCDRNSKLAILLWPCLGQTLPSHRRRSPWSYATRQIKSSIGRGERRRMELTITTSANKLRTCRSFWFPRLTRLLYLEALTWRFQWTRRRRRIRFKFWPSTPRVFIQPGATLSRLSASTLLRVTTEDLCLFKGRWASSWHFLWSSLAGFGCTT